MNDTRKKILKASLDIFSEKGYDGTNLNEIAEKCGIVKSALYRHFKSKEEIIDTLINNITEYYNKKFGAVNNMPDIPNSCDEFVDMVMRMVRFTINDEQIIKARKFITLEQFRDERAIKLATMHFLTDLQLIFSRIFDGMMKNGSIKENNTEILAFSFATPISALIHLCDREPDKKEVALKDIEKFIKHFVSVYGNEKDI